MKPDAEEICSMLDTFGLMKPEDALRTLAAMSISGLLKFAEENMGRPGATCFAPSIALAFAIESKGTSDPAATMEAASAKFREVMDVLYSEYAKDES